jgi:predicted RNA polymerase sigma factor
VFTACHPVLSTEARVALTLRVLGGLTTDEIARAFLVPEATVAQRIVRAKRTLAEARVPFEVPRRHELAARLASVLEVIYLIFNEGYSATAGERLDAPRAVRGGAAPGPHRGRAGAEGAGGAWPRGADGNPGLAHRGARGRLGRAGAAARAEPRALGPDAHSTRPRGAGACRVARRRARALRAAGRDCRLPCRARTAGETDWTRIAALYDALAQLAPSPIVELNRAVALSMAFGPAAGLEVVDGLMDEPALKGYHLLPTVRGDLLFKLGRHDEARREFDRAAALTRNTRERALLLARARACMPV